MDLSSIFKPRTSASSRFRPFYGEIGGFPWGYEEEGTYGPGIERQPTEPGVPNLMSERVGGVSGQDEVYIPQKDVTAGAPEPVDFGGAGYGGGGGGEWDEDFDFDDWEDYDIDPNIPGAELDVQRGFLPTQTPTFNVNNPYYGVDNQERERWYSGSYGWRLPGGPHYSAPSGGYNPYQKWGGQDMQYALGSFGPENEAAWGTNVTPYEDRWFYGNNLLPTSYESLIEDVVTTPSSNADVFATTTGIIPSWAGIMEPEVAGYYEYQPPKEMTLWGTPHTAYSRVNELSGPSFVDPYYEDLYGFS